MSLTYTSRSRSRSPEFDDQITPEPPNNLDDLYNNETRSSYPFHSSERSNLLRRQSRSQNLYPPPSPSLLSSYAHPAPRPRSSELSLGKLLSYPVVQQLYNDLAEANRALASQAQMQQELLRLLGMIQPGAGAGHLDSRFRQVFIVTVTPKLLNQNYQYRTNEYSMSRSASLAPSDSLSQAPSKASIPPISNLHQPASRPPEYPFEVLWCFEDCKKDPDAKISPGNSSRPSMQTVIRNPDGTLISDGIWNSIRLSSREVVNFLLDNVSITARDATRPKTKQFFKSFHSEHWRKAIEHLELLQPLLQLCTGHWKADHVLGSTLASNTQHDSSKPVKRHAPDDGVPIAKKPREDDITAKAVRTMHKRNSKAPRSVDAAPAGAISSFSPSDCQPFNAHIIRPAIFSREGRETGTSESGSSAAASTNNLPPSSSQNPISSQPKPVDPSCANLICKSFRSYKISAY